LRSPALVSKKTLGVDLVGCLGTKKCFRSGEAKEPRNRTKYD